MKYKIDTANKTITVWGRAVNDELAICYGAAKGAINRIYTYEKQLNLLT
ncbi:hypothetical protein [Pedobacter sp. P26]